jgi:hypothetical protein
MILGALRWQVFYYKANQRLETKKINDLLRRLHVSPIDFQKPEEIDTGYAYGDLHDIAGEVTASFWDPALVVSVEDLFPNVSDLAAKLRLVFRSFVDSRCRDLPYIVTWAASLENRTVYVLMPVCPIRRRYIQIANTQARPMLFCSALFLMELIASTARPLTRSLAQLAGRLSAAPDAANKKRLPGDITGRPDYEHEVLFFPHKTISYGRLFLKDQFYTDSHESPFHPSKILHVELEPPPEKWITPNLCDVYENYQISYCLLPKVPKKERIRIGTQVAATIYKHWRLKALRPGSFLLVSAIFLCCLDFESYRIGLRKFTGARLALLGYEMLFPKALSMALESRGVTTLATQERFFTSTFFKNFGFIVDTFLVASDFVCNKLVESDEKWIRRCIRLGLIRSDLLVEPTSKQTLMRNHKFPTGKTVIVAFDYNSVADESFNRRIMIYNWKANQGFYEDLLRLAREVPEVHIIIRGKDDVWQYLPYFSDILKKIEEQANIDINNDYENFAVQYKIAAAADVVIAKPSSIADECLAAGKPVIYYDFLPNSRHVFSKIFEYQGIPIFANSYDALVDKVKRCVAGGTYLEQGEMSKLQELVNGGAADGKVKVRLQQQMIEIYTQAMGTSLTATAVNELGTEVC